MSSARSPPSARCGRSPRTAKPVDIAAYLEQARTRLDRVSPDRLQTELDAGALLVDVRTYEQRQRDGELPGAAVIDLTVLEWRLAPSSPYRAFDLAPEQLVIVMCNQGFSSSLAAARLRDLGVNATDLIGGFTAWKVWVETGG